MDAHRRNQAARVRPAGITALELWDLVVDGKSLFAARDDADFCARLASAVGVLRADHEFSRVWIAGGGAARKEVALAPAMRAAGVTFTIAPLGQFAIEPGGFALAAGRNPLVVDVGQTAIKLMWPGGRRRIDRDFQRLPTGAGEHGRRELRAFISGAIAGVPAPIDSLVLALPSEIDDALVPGDCSYAGIAGDARLIDDVLAAARLEHIPVAVLNDAELAAVSARLDRPHESLLVLTLGYGVGCAIVSGE